MNILLTGGTGFIGSYVVDELCKQGHHVVIITRQEKLLKNVSKNVSFQDANNINLANCFLNSIDMVIHLASQFDREGNNRKSVFNTNVYYPRDLIMQAMRLGCRYFVNTDSYYTLQPEQFLHLKNYVDSKIEFSGQLKKIRNLKVVNMRLFHVYGEGDNPCKFIPWITSRLINGGQNIRLKSPCSQILDFVHVTDVAKSYAKVVSCIEELDQYSEFDIGTGKGTELKQVCQYIRELIQSYKDVKVPQLIFAAPALSDFPSKATFVASNTKIDKIHWNPTIDASIGIKNYVENELQVNDCDTNLQ